MDENYEEGGFSPYPGFRWYNNLRALSATPQESQQSEQPSSEFAEHISQLVHPVEQQQHGAPVFASSSQYRQYDQDMFMMPCNGLDDIYSHEQLLLCKKFERAIKSLQDQLLSRGNKQDAYYSYRKLYLNSEKFFARYFATQVQNIVLLIGAYDAFRDQFARRGFLVNPDPKSNVFNVKLCVKLADSHWSQLNPFQYVNHIQGIIHLTVKGQLLRTVMQDDADIDGLSYCPRAYRVITVSEKSSKVSLGANDETALFLKEFVHLEAAKQVQQFISDCDTCKVTKSAAELEIALDDEAQRLVADSNQDLSMEYRKTLLKAEMASAAANSAEQSQFLAEHRQVYTALHIIRHFLSNIVIDQYPIRCASISVPSAMQVIELIPKFPSAYPIPAFAREFEGYCTRDNKYVDALRQHSLQWLYFEAQFVLAQFKKQKPQNAIDGSMNVWICKPSQKSRGRGIFASTDLNQLLTLSCEQVTQLPEEDLIDSDDSYIVQKYIERPLLIHGYKFDIRQWVLISSVNPMIIWQWTRPYLRFCSEPYTSGDFSNPFVHLSNNSVQKYSQAFGTSIDGNMWHFAQMCEYIDQNSDLQLRQKALVSKYDSTIVFAQIGERILYDMARIAITTIQAARANMSEKSGFELLGYDFLIDQDLQVWLLEINASPTMEYSTSLVKQLIEEMAAGYVAIIVDAFCGRRVQTNGFKLFPKILNQAQVLSQGIPGWSLIWKEDTKMREETIINGLGVQGSEIRLPRFVQQNQ